MKPIPIAKPLTDSREKKAIDKVLNSGMLAQGEQVAQFEENFAKYCGVDYAVAVSNGTSALMLTLAALNIKREVIIPGFTFIACATSVVSQSAKPVFADIDANTYNLSPEDTKKKLAHGTQAIMPVHLYGQPADMDEFMEMSEKNSVYIIEDAAQAHGATWNKKKVGSFGEAGCFSFYPTKNMTTGEGGIVTTNNSALAARIQSLRNHGQSGRYNHTELAFNYRMTNIHAAIGIEQLKKLDKFNRARRKNAEYYDTHLDYDSPYVDSRATHVYHQYTIRTKKRDLMAEHFRANAVGYAIHYDTPAYKQPVFGLNLNLKNTESACYEVFSIPVHPAISQSDRKRVVETVNSFGFE